MNENALIYEYAVLRFVPRIEREEFINIGLLMVCKRRRWLRGAVTLDPARILAFDPGADIEALERQTAMFDPASGALAECTAEERFRWFSAVKSSILQTSRPHPGLIDTDGSADPASLLEATFLRLYETLVLP